MGEERCDSDIHDLPICSSLHLSPLFFLISSPLSPLPTVALTTSCFLLEAPHNIFFMHLFFARLTAFIQEHPSPFALSLQLFLRRLNAATVIENMAAAVRHCSHLLTAPQTTSRRARSFFLSRFFFCLFFLRDFVARPHTCKHVFYSREMWPGSYGDNKQSHQMLNITQLLLIWSASTRRAVRGLKWRHRKST